MEEEIDVFCEHLTRVAAEMLQGGPLTALVQADDNERLRLTVIFPDEFYATMALPAENTLSSMTELLFKVQDFALNHYRDNFFMEESWKKFCELPGRFVFLCKDAPRLCYRLAQWRVTERFGHRFFKGIDLYEDSLQIRMLGGNYPVKLNRFRGELKKHLDAMALLLRKPIRKKYDK